jgi:hypothetical protein
MDSNLRDILINTYNPDKAQRTHAENSLDIFLHNNGALYSLLSFLQNQEVEIELRKAAAIYIKNKSRQFYRLDEAKILITEEEKEVCKGLFLEILLIENDNVIRGMLAESIRNISEYDYPDRFIHSLSFVVSSFPSLCLDGHN